MSDLRCSCCDALDEKQHFLPLYRMVLSLVALYPKPLKPKPQALGSGFPVQKNSISYYDILPYIYEIMIYNNIL